MEFRGRGCVSFKRQALKEHLRSRVWDQGLVLLTRCGRGAGFRSGDRADPESGAPGAHMSRPWPWPLPPQPGQVCRRLDPRPPLAEYLPLPCNSPGAKGGQVCLPIRKEGKSLHQPGRPLAAWCDDQGPKGGGHPRAPTRACAGQWGADTNTSVCTHVRALGTPL